MSGKNRNTSSSTKPLWAPDGEWIDNTLLTAFARRYGFASDDYQKLHRWSVDSIGDFWSAVWDFCGVIGDKGTQTVNFKSHMRHAAFFPQAKLSFARNLLRRDNHDEAIVFKGEDKVERRLSWRELNQFVSRCQQAMANGGIKDMTRVAAVMPNMPETVIAMLATNSLGAVWASCSPDFGVSGIADRFSQIEPELLIICDGYWFGGKKFTLIERIDQIWRCLPSLKQIVVVDYLGEADKAVTLVKSEFRNILTWNDFLAELQAQELNFFEHSFDHPLAILFSSGTTGAPKCIVHKCGGVLLQHLKEHQLHSNIKPDDRVFYYSTCGWMMWNWLVSALASQATILLYDGSAALADGAVLLDYAASERATFFGVSAQYLRLIAKNNLKPIADHDLTSLRTIASTGSPLAPELFNFVYSDIKHNVHLASISGGTDIVSCFVLGNPNAPVWPGEIQCKGLGMAVEIWGEDVNHSGASHSLSPGQKGDLVCVKPFPSMPLKFWRDADDKRYHNAYFARFDGIWSHGDYAELTEHGGIIIHGRSDAVLNPGGVRIGTAEIYTQVESIPQVVEALAVGQQWLDDVRVLLFVRLQPDLTLTKELNDKIKKIIRVRVSPRHVPAMIIQAPAIPKTKSGKIVELAVRDIINGKPVKNRQSLANPESLDFFQDIASKIK